MSKKVIYMFEVNRSGYIYNINKHQEETTMSDRIVCDCVGTTVEDIKTAVANGAKTVEDIKEATEAGTICCGCDCEIETTLHEVL